MDNVIIEKKIFVCGHVYASQANAFNQDVYMLNNVDLS